MTTRNEQIVLTRGDSLVITHTVKDCNGEIVSIEGSIPYFTVSTTKDRTSDENVEIQKEGIITDATGGKCTFTLLPIDTDLPSGTYYFDIEIKFSTTDVRTSMDGTFTIINDVTKT